MALCTKCKKRVAIVYTSRYDNGKRIDEGYCIKCAYESGLSGISEMFSAAGINESNIDEMSDRVERMLGANGESADPTEFFRSIMNNEFSDDGISDNLYEDSEDDEDDKDGDEYSEYDDGSEKGISGTGTTRGDEEEEPSDSGNAKRSFLDILAGNQERKGADKNAKKTQRRKLKYLREFGTDLTERAANGKIDRILCRDKEIDRMVQILNRRTKNNPVVIGAPGVGKTAVAQGLALKIVEGKVPEKLLNMRVWQLDLPAMVAGTQFRGQFESRIKGVINEAIREENVILVIDELHTIMGAGDSEGSTNAANILKPALARGELRIIGSTTTAEYRKIEKDAALERRFQKVMLEEPSVEASIEILKGIRDYYEKHHNVSYSDEVIEFAVKASKRYITDRYLPDKAIDLIDEAGSRANLENVKLVKLAKTKEKLEEAQTRYTEVGEAMSSLPAEEQDVGYEKMAESKADVERLQKEYDALGSSILPDPITIEDIAKVVEMWTGIPLKSISESESQKLINLEAGLHRRVIGQEAAVSAVARAVRRNRSGFTKKHKPASFIFVGPTGVGKTELVKALAEVLFDSEDALIRIDMSEYMESYSVSKLIGSPPGYVGHEESGQLTEQVRRKPYSVILFDEIEKAHSDVFNLLLQLLDEGRLTDSHGLLVNFENTIIVMTSNAGSTSKANAIGFYNDTRDALESKVKTALKETFKPEFLNRVDETVIFTRLNREEIRSIAGLMMKEVFEALAEKHVKGRITEAAVDRLAETGYDEKYGARSLRKVIRTDIEDRLTDMYLQGGFEGAEEIVIDFVDGKYTFDTNPSLKNKDDEAVVVVVPDKEIKKGDK